MAPIEPPSPNAANADTSTGSRTPQRSRRRRQPLRDRPFAVDANVWHAAKRWTGFVRTPLVVVVTAVLIASLLPLQNPVGAQVTSGPSSSVDPSSSTTSSTSSTTVAGSGSTSTTSSTSTSTTPTTSTSTTSTSSSTTTTSTTTSSTTTTVPPVDPYRPPTCNPANAYYELVTGSASCISATSATEMKLTRDQEFTVAPTPPTDPGYTSSTGCGDLACTYWASGWRFPYGNISTISGCAGTAGLESPGTYTRTPAPTTCTLKIAPKAGIRAPGAYILANWVKFFSIGYSPTVDTYWAHIDAVIARASVTAASGAGSFSTAYLVKAGADPLISACVAEPDYETLWTPAYVGPDCIRMVVSNYSTSGGYASALNGAYSIWIDPFGYPTGARFSQAKTNWKKLSIALAGANVNLTATKSNVPEPSFTVEKLPGTSAGTYRFTSTTAPFNGFVPTLTWTFGDGTAAVQGPDTVIHEFTKPGAMTVTLKAAVGSTEGSASQVVNVPAPQLAIDVVLSDGASRIVLDQEFGVSVIVSASDGVGGLGAISLGDLGFGPTTSLVRVGTAPVVTQTTLAGGTQFVINHRFKATKTGPVSFTVNGRASDAANRFQIATGTLNKTVQSDALAVTVTPAVETFKLEENADGPVPKKVVVTVSVKNTSTLPIDAVTLPDDLILGVIATQPPAIKHIKQTKKPATLLLGTLPAGVTRTADYEVEIDDDGTFSIDALVTSATENGLGKGRIKANTKFLFSFKGEYDGAVVVAGNNIIVTGTIKNLTNDRKLRFEVIDPERTGNAGIPWVSTSGVPRPKPGEVPPPVTIELEPGASTPFYVAMPTFRSSVLPSEPGTPTTIGGTKATVTFKPRAWAIDEDGQEVESTDDDVLSTEAGTTFRAAIDDSIAMDEPGAFEWSVIGSGAFSYGLGKNLADSFIGAFTLLLSIPGGAAGLASDPGKIVRGPTSAYYSAWAAWNEYEAEAWRAMTPEERKVFLDAESQLAAVGLKNYSDSAWRGLVLKDRAAKAYAELEKYLDAQSVSWYTGGWRDVVRGSSEAGGTVASQYIQMRAMPALMKSPQAVAAFGRLKRVADAKKAEFVAALTTAASSEQVVEAMRKLDVGMELTIRELAMAYGVSESEAQYLANLAKEWKAMIVFRSRHRASIKWLRQGAVVKSEAVKVKNVSDIDAAWLGYRNSDVGRLAFRQPVGWAEIESKVNEMLALDKQLDKLQRAYASTPSAQLAEEIANTKAALATASKPVKDFGKTIALRQGVPATDAELLANVSDRAVTRLKEWGKYGSEYTKGKYLDGKGVPIDVGYNYAENGIVSSVRQNQSRWRKVKVVNENGNFVFKQTDLNQIYRDITGDIDFLDILKLDGTLFDQTTRVNQYRTLQKGIVNMQHGESGTSVGFWRAYLEQQPADELYVMMGPDGVARTVRYNARQSVVIEGEGRILSAKHSWDGGYKVAGSSGVSPSVGTPADEVLTDVGFGKPQSLFNSAPQQAQLVRAQMSPSPQMSPSAAQDGSAAGGQTPPVLIGRCLFTASTSLDAPIVVLYDTTLATVGDDGSIDLSLDTTCRASGPQLNKLARLGTTTTGWVTDDGWRLGIADPDPTVGNAQIPLGGAVLVDAGGPNQEFATPVFHGSLIFDPALKNLHEADELVFPVKTPPAGFVPYDPRPAVPPTGIVPAIPTNPDISVSSTVTSGESGGSATSTTTTPVTTRQPESTSPTVSSEVAGATALRPTTTAPLAVLSAEPMEGAATTESVAFTGSNAMALCLVALVLMIVGTGMISPRRRRGPR